MIDPFPHALGEFSLEGILGQGGSGVVYDATWGPRRVALKVLHAGLAGTERVRAQFLDEARRLQAVGHASVVKVLAVGELPDGRPFLAMERLAGETLASVLARGPLALADAVSVFAELCDAVEALHAQGLVHRDLKPENVFIVDGRHAVLLDFGIAKELSAAPSTTTMDGGVRGTPAYMAPERFFGQPAGVPTDVYELAVTLYAMLAGRLPWDDVADPEARLSPRPLDPLRVAAELDVVIRRAMSTRAQNRPATATALLHAVRAAAAGSAEPAPGETARMGSGEPWFGGRQRETDRGKTPLAWAPSEPQQAVPPRRRRRWPFVVAGVATLGALGVAIALRTDDTAVEPAVTSEHSPDAAVVAETPVDAPAGVVATSSDPWDQPLVPREPDKPPPKLALSGPPLEIPQARKELAASLVHVPADTRVVFTIGLGELRANEQFADVLERVGKTPMLAAAAVELPPCVRAVVGDAEWAVYASQALDDSRHATLIIRGRWTRTDIERCFADDTQALAMPDGAKMLQLRRVGWIDFLDDHTVYLSVRDDLAAAQVHDLVRHGNGPTAHVRELLAALPADRAVTAVIDGSAGLVWPKDYLPKGSDVTAWLRVDTFSTFDVIADTHSAAAAAKVVAEVKPTFAELFKDHDSSILGSVAVVRERTAMRIRGKMSSLMVAMISSAIP